MYGYILVFKLIIDLQYVYDEVVFMSEQSEQGDLCFGDCNLKQMLAPISNRLCNGVVDNNSGKKQEKKTWTATTTILLLQGPATRHMFVSRLHWSNPIDHTTEEPLDEYSIGLNDFSETLRLAGGEQCKLQPFLQQIVH